MAWQAGKKTAFALIVLGVTGLATAAVTDTISNRQHNMKAMGGAAKAIGDELKSSSPSVPTIQANAAKLQGLAPNIESWFPQGSGPESGAKTHALPAIWSNRAEFHKDAVAFKQAVDALAVAAKGGNVAQIGPAMGAVGNGCKTCHETFKQRGD